MQIVPYAEKDSGLWVRLGVRAPHQPDWGVGLSHVFWKFFTLLSMMHFGKVVQGLCTMPWTFIRGWWLIAGPPSPGMNDIAQAPIVPDEPAFVAFPAAGSLHSEFNCNLDSNLWPGRALCSGEARSPVQDCSFCCETVLHFILLVFWPDEIG